jgi:hypothetical protein
MEKAAAKKTLTVYVKLDCFIKWCPTERVNLNVKNVLLEEDVRIVCDEVV